MLRPLAVQLYSLRDYAKDDFVGVLKKVADIGYKAVEPAGFWNLTPAEFKKIIDDLGLKIYSSHSPWLRDEATAAEALDTLDILGIKQACCGYGPDNFKDLDAIKATAENTNKLIEIAKKRGITVFQHNHYWEFEKIDGKFKYDIYLEYCPEIKFELDAFWSTNLGKEDAVAMMKRYADRVVQLHMKDGICSQKAENAGMVNGLLDMKIDLLPLGTGSLPIKDIVDAAPASCETIVVELDYCEVEMWKAIEQSYKFMTENGIAAGNK